jgi:DNA-binding transcriptional LysR family regulator
MRLTPAGEEVYQTCHVLFSTFEELDERLARQSEDQGAEARIAVTQ